MNIKFICKPFIWINSKISEARDGLYELMPGSSSGSKARNMISATAAIWTAIVLVEIIFAELFEIAFLKGVDWNRTLASFWVTMAFVVFAFNVLAVIRLHNKNYLISGGRLIRDVTISASLTIVSFAWFYRYAGLSSGEGERNAQCFFEGQNCVCDASPMDTLYFSVVTFSTLGFGDYTACSYKIVSALEALLGNLHLGIFVGAVFYYLTESASEK